MAYWICFAIWFSPVMWHFKGFVARATFVDKVTLTPWSTCKSHVLSSDGIQLNATVRVKERQVATVRVVIVGESSLLCTILPHECSSDRKDGYCKCVEMPTSTPDHTDHLLTVSIIGKAWYSQRPIKFQLLEGGQLIEEREPIAFPYIHDTSRFTLELVANSKAVPMEHGCEYSLTRCSDPVKYCCSELPHQCRVNLFHNHRQVNSNDTGCLWLNKLPARNHSLTASICGAVFEPPRCSLVLDYRVDSKLTVNDQRVSLSSGRCSFNLDSCKNTVKFCCTYSGGPCSVYINSVATAGSMGKCASQTVPISYTGVFNLSASVCSHPPRLSLQCVAVSGFITRRLSLYLDGGKVNLNPPGGCIIEMSARPQELKFCCVHSHLQCHVNIIYSGIINSDSPCVVRMVSLSDNSSAVLTYSMCGLNAEDGYICRLEPGPCRAGQNLTLAMSARPLTSDMTESSVTCHWKNNCPHRAWGFSLRSTTGYLFSHFPGIPSPLTDHPGALLEFSNLSLTSGHITLRFTQPDCKLAVHYTCVAGFTQGTDLSFTMDSIDLPFADHMLRVNMTSGPGVLDHRAELTCQWHNLCPSYDWQWRLSSSTGLLVQGGPQGPDQASNTPDFSISFQRHSQRSGNILFTVRSLRCSDAVEYTCVAWYTEPSHAHLSGHSESTILNLIIPPSTPNVVGTVPGLDQLSAGVKEHTQVSLTCSAILGFPGLGRLDWAIFRKGKVKTLLDQVTITSYKVPLLPGDSSCVERVESQLNLSATRLEDGFQFACYVHNAAFIGMSGDICALHGPRFCTLAATVNVFFGVSTDRMDMLRDPLILYGGERLTLTCVAEGYPVPTYNWTLESQPDSILNSTEEGAVSHLTIAQVTKSQVGTYICTATNEVLGRPYTASQRLNIILHSKPKQGLLDQRSFSEEIQRWRRSCVPLVVMLVLALMIALGFGTCYLQPARDNQQDNATHEDEMGDNLFSPLPTDAGTPFSQSFRLSDGSTEL